jgi:dUTP pyrophosphatase
MKKIRGFEKVTREKNNKELKLPKRSTKHSAAYDFFLPKDIEIPAKKHIKIHSGIKSYFLPDEVLFIFTRSSLGTKKGIILRNTTGVIDSDYYNNSDNEGEIIITLFNTSTEDVKIKKNEKFCQAVFQKFLIADQGDSKQKRLGGLGSTGK